MSSTSECATVCPTFGWPLRTVSCVTWPGPNRRGFPMGSDNRAVIDRIRAICELGDPAELAKATDELAARDFVQEWPQSGERLSLEAFRKVNEGYEQATGNAPKMSLRRILGE